MSPCPLAISVPPRSGNYVLAESSRSGPLNVGPAYSIEFVGPFIVRLVGLYVGMNFIEKFA